MGFNAKDLKEAGKDANSEHASDTGCLKCELTFARMANEAQDALKVILLTPHIRRYLLANDPMAFEQAHTAARLAKVCTMCGRLYTPDELECSPFAVLCRDCDD